MLLSVKEEEPYTQSVLDGGALIGISPRVSAQEECRAISPRVALAQVLLGKESSFKFLD